MRLAQAMSVSADRGFGALARPHHEPHAAKSLMYDMVLDRYGHCL